MLDFGCGWGRLTRMLARDVPYERLCGCDPSEEILDVCRRDRVPARLARSAYMPDCVPFDGPFDLAFAFSVFTHLSEPAHERCLDALHAALAPGAILVVTVRPSAYLSRAPAAYTFVPHPADASHPQYGGGEMHYGEAVVRCPTYASAGPTGSRCWTSTSCSTISSRSCSRFAASEGRRGIRSAGSRARPAWRAPK